ncbi:MAG: FliA/WhiG family RNA polymerase sigma factor [Chloroflexi bacterium CFX7]|nr:FliA/WhiG family RNA polymerase sigma factor [Chloroflexi bacterium CFX7]RIL02224.1 MAG: FliA/WhiG family RNA polymerase sigma factor [bacterium]
MEPVPTTTKQRGCREGSLGGQAKMYEPSQSPGTTENAPAGNPGDEAVDTGQRLSLEEQQQLVMQYAPLVRRVARSLPLEIPGLLEFEDAVGYGTCGLVEAVRRYDPSKGTNFHAYAVRRIRGSMIDAFRRMDRLSRTMRQKAREVQRAQGELETSLGRTPSEQETAEHMGISISQFRDASANARWVTISLDRILDKDDAGDSFPAAEMPTSDEDIDFTRGFEEKELHQELARAVQTLPERERLVIALYYVEHLTMKDISLVLSVSETRVSQLHAQAVKRLRRALLREAA